VGPDVKCIIQNADTYRNETPCSECRSGSEHWINYVDPKDTGFRMQVGFSKILSLECETTFEKLDSECEFGSGVLSLLLCPYCVRFALYLDESEVQ